MQTVLIVNIEITFHEGNSVSSYMNALFILTFILFTSTLVHADVRNDAIIAISRLQNAGVAQKMPDETHSMESTFMAAEKHLQANDHANADQYYRLAIQKAQILATLMLDLKTEAAVPASIQPSNGQPTSTPSVPAGHTTAPVPDSPPESVPVINTASPTNEESTQAETQTAPEDESDYSPGDSASAKLVGNVSIYIVRKNDSLRLVAAKLGVSRQHLTQVNRLDTRAFLKIGQKLKYNNRKIVPQQTKNGIVINIPDRTLYYFRQGKLRASMPVALGVAKKNNKFDWKTPIGKFKVTAKQKDPTWYVPLSIRSEMEDDGKEVITSVPPGPANPLGRYAIKTSLPGILIHSTTKPGSIYSFASHGCIRVNPEHMEELFKEIKVNTLGEIIYRPVKLAVTEQGRIFMEVHQDAYGKNMELDAEAKKLIEKLNLAERIDWAKVKSMLKLKAGIAEDITL